MNMTELTTLTKGPVLSRPLDQSVMRLYAAAPALGLYLIACARQGDTLARDLCVQADIQWSK